MFVRSAACLRQDERFLIIEDAASRPIGDAIARAASELGAWVRRIDLDATGSSRPLRILPDVLVAAIQQATSSAFIAGALRAEAPMRQGFLHVVGERGVRHAHLPDIREPSFLSGFQVDYSLVGRVGTAALEILTQAKEIVCESDAGTRLTVRLRERGRWFAQLGAITPGHFGNLPAGALYASPIDANGVMVVDASLGEFFGAREGLLREKHVLLAIEKGEVRDVDCPRAPALQRDIEAMLSFSANSRRVGLVAIGVNQGIAEPTGEAIVDQNLPGLHLGIGDPAGKDTGAGWSAPTCFAACQARSRVVVDGELLMEDGRLAGRLSRLALGSPEHRAARATP
jgi:hypothetical protein